MLDNVGHLPRLTRSLVAAIVVPLVGLTSCVTYHAKPLDSDASMPGDVARLYVDTTSMPSPELREHRFDPSDGLDQTEVAMLAVANNPELRAMRDDLGIQRAQAFAAGLLPDPQVSYGQDIPIHSAPDLVTGSIADLTLDLSSLLLHSTASRASRFDVRKVELDELWAEWQTIAQARTLFGQVRADETLLGELEPLLPTAQRLAQSIDAAVSAGNLSSDAAAGGLLSVAELKRQIADVAQRLNEKQHSLRQLLGLGERAELHLVDAPRGCGARDTHRRRRRIVAGCATSAPARSTGAARGLRRQEQRVREAVLKQFPSITVGINRATDTSDITTRGYNIALSLPLFNRGRGDIAIETATRQKLFDEYQSRLAATRSDVDRIRADLPVIERQLQDAERDAGRLREAQQAAERAFAAGNLDWNTYLTLSTSAAARRVEIEQLALAWSEQKSALQSLLGTELPTFPTPEPQR
jgi:outer membrane protein TolC